MCTPAPKAGSHHGDGVQVPAGSRAGGVGSPDSGGSRYGVPQPLSGDLRPGEEDDGGVAVPLQGGEQTVHTDFRGRTRGCERRVPAGAGAERFRAVRGTRRLAVSVVTKGLP